MEMDTIITTPIKSSKRKLTKEPKVPKAPKKVRNTSDEETEVIEDIEEVIEFPNMASSDSNQDIEPNFIYDPKEFSKLKKFIDPAKVVVRKINGEVLFETQLGNRVSQIIGLRVNGELIGAYCTVFGLVASIFVKNAETANQYFFPLVDCTKNYSINDLLGLYSKFYKDNHFIKSPKLYTFMRSLLWCLNNLFTQINESENGGDLFRPETTIVIDSDQLSGLKNALSRDNRKTTDFLLLGSIVYRSFVKSDCDKFVKPEFQMSIEQQLKLQEKDDLRNRVSILPGNELVDVRFNEEDNKLITAGEIKVTISKSELSIGTSTNNLILKVN